MMMNKYRVHEVAKDLGAPSKSVVDLLQKYFEGPVKHMTALTEDQLDIVLEYFTQNNQVENFDAYFATAAEKKPEKKPEAPKAAENPAAPAASGKRPAEGQKGASPAPGKNAAPGRGPAQVRHVDTRSAHVEMEKYNEKYERIAPANTTRSDNIVHKQKIKQRSQDRRPPRARRETEAERLKRLAMERQKKAPMKVTVGEEITVGELAMRLKIQANEVIKQLMKLGVMANVTQSIDYDTAELVAGELNAIVERDRLSGDLAQLSCELLLLRRGEGYGGDGRHLQNAVIPVVQFGKSVTAVGKVADIAPFRQDFHKIQNIGMHRATEAGV